MTPDQAAELIRELATMITRRDNSHRESIEAGRHVERIVARLCEDNPLLVGELTARFGRGDQQEGVTKTSHAGLLTLTDYGKLHGVDRRQVYNAIEAGQITAPAVTSDRFIRADLADRQLAALDETHRTKLVRSARKKLRLTMAEIVEQVPAPIAAFINPPSDEAAKVDTAVADALPVQPPKRDVGIAAESEASGKTDADDEIDVGEAVLEQLAADPAHGPHVNVESVKAKVGAAEQAFEAELVDKGCLKPDEATSTPKDSCAVAPTSAPPAPKRAWAFPPWNKTAAERTRDTADQPGILIDPDAARPAKAKLPVLGRINGDDRPPPDPDTLALRAIPAAQIPRPEVITVSMAITLLRTRGYEVLPMRGKAGVTSYKVGGRMQTEEEMILKIEGILEREERARERRERQAVRP